MDCDSADTLDIFCREGSDTMLHVAKVDDALRLGQLWSDLLIVFLAIEAAVIMLLFILIRCPCSWLLSYCASA